MDSINWRFDIRTAVITVVLVPLILFLLTIVLKHLKNWGGYMLEGILYWMSRSIKHSLAAHLTLKRYCRLQLAGSSQYLYVPASIDTKLEIDSVYVTLTLEQQGGKQINYNHADVLSVGNRMRIIGDPGSGKSSLVKRIFRDMCIMGGYGPSSSQLPILMELKNLEIPTDMKQSDWGTWFYGKLRDDAANSAVYRMAECFDNYAETAGLLVLLDGLDEVSSSRYLSVETAIKSLSDKLSQMGERNTIVLTMRTQFHHQIKGGFRDYFQNVLFLKPFTPTDIYDFLTRWPFRENAKDNISRIYKDLTDRPTLREMCSNPLVLSMYVAEDQAGGNALTLETRTEFYSKVTEELIIRRRLHQTGRASAPTKLREQRERILGKLAYEHLIDPNQPTNSLRWSDGIRIIKEVMHSTDSEAASVFLDLAKETGLITEEQPMQTFRFIHLTFCEFLAAYEAIQGQKHGWASLIYKHLDFQKLEHPQLRSRLLEVLPFACGLLPRVKRYNAINDVSSLRDNRLLANVFLETKLYDHPIWSDFINSEKNRLLNTPEEKWDEQWLRDLHLFNVSVRDANLCFSHMPTPGGMINLAVFFKALVERQQASLSTLLSAYATQDAAAAFRLAEVCNLDLAESFPEIIVTNCDQLPFLGLILEQSKQEINHIGIWATLLAEAALRSRLVAHLLSEKGSESFLYRYVEEVPRHKRWFSRFLLPESFYTQILTIAVGPRAKPMICSTVLNQIRHVPAPNSSHLKGCLKYSLIAGTLHGMLPLLIVKVNNPLDVISPTYIVMLTGTFFFYYFMIRRFALRPVYENLLLLDRPYDFDNNHTPSPRLERKISVFEKLGYRVLGRTFLSLFDQIKQQRDVPISNSGRTTISEST